MMKKIKNIFKIFLALIIVFSQLSNATIVLAAEIADTAPIEDSDTVGEEVEETKEEDLVNDTDNDGTDENLEDDNEENTDVPSENGEDNPLDNGEGNSDNAEINPEDPTTGEDEMPEEKTEFTLEDLEVLMNAYINEEEVPEELINLLIEKGAPSIVNGEFTELTLEDIMFVSELLKEEADIDTEREENEYLKLELGEVPSEVKKGDTFDVEVIVSNEILEELTDEDGNLIVSEDFIDGIEGLITTSDNLKVVNVEFGEFTGANNEEGKFIATGSEYSEDKGVLFTITFEALEEGIGEVTISGKLAKYLTISDFEDLTFNIQVISSETGLSSLNSDIGEFDKEFDSDTTEYTLTVPEGTTEITLSGSLFNEDDEVVGLSSYTIDSDNMTITIVVTTLSGEEKTYIINVVKVVNSSSEEETTEEVMEVVETPAVPIVYYVYSSNNYLKSLNIKDFDIDFNKNTLEYKLKVKSDVKFLDITAVAEDYRSRVEISGNEEFKEGENVVTIKVTAEDGSVREYKVLVDKEVAKDDKVVEKDNSGTTEKIVIIVLIVLVVLGLLYLIFKKDEEENNKAKDVKNDNNSKKSKER